LWRGPRTLLQILVSILAGLLFVNSLQAGEVDMPGFDAQRVEMVRIAAFGNSLTAGYGLADAESFPQVLERFLRKRDLPVEVLNFGVSGDTTSGGLARLEWSLADNPDMVILELGANDVLRGIAPARVRANLEAMLRILASRDIPVLLAGMLAPRNLGREYAHDFDAIYPDLAKAYEVELYPFFLDGVAGDPALNLGDGIHPNAAGVAEIVQRIGPMVEEMVREILRRKESKQ
jgi:acyl-CoA thioesterase I